MLRSSRPNSLEETVLARLKKEHAKHSEPNGHLKCKARSFPLSAALSSRYKEDIVLDVSVNLNTPAKNNGSPDPSAGFMQPLCKGHYFLCASCVITCSICLTKTRKHLRQGRELLPARQPFKTGDRWKNVGDGSST